MLTEEFRYEIRSAERGCHAARVGPRVARDLTFRGPNSSRRGWRRPQGLVLALLIMAASGARAASSEPGAAAPTANAVNVTPAAIPAARIAEGVETCRERLSEIETLLADDPRAEAVQSGLPDAQKKLAKLSRQSWSAISLQSPSGFLLDVEDQWSSWKDRLETWQRTLADSVAQLDTALTELGDLRRQWEDTRDSAATQQLPTPLTDSIERASGSGARITRRPSRCGRNPANRSNRLFQGAR